MLMVPSTHGFLSALAVGWDPANISNSSAVVLSNSNKTVTENFNAGQPVVRGFGQNSGKRYFELTIGGNTSVNQYMGICNGSFAVVNNNLVGGDTNGISISPASGVYGVIYNSAVIDTVVVAPTGSGVGDVIMIAADLTGGQVFLGVNGVWANNSGSPGTTSGAWQVSGATKLYPVVSLFAQSTVFGAATLNTGDTTFAYALPSGYIAWG